MNLGFRKDFTDEVD
jgi:hypothetical protein